MKEHYYVGVDLGQSRDHSAIAIVETSESLGAVRDPVSYAFPVHKHIVLRQLDRIPLGTEYTTVAGLVGQVARGLERLGPATIVVDASGVGSAVVEMIRKSAAGRRLVPVVITSGVGSNHSGGKWNVGKRELMSVLRMLIEQKTLFYASDLAGKEILLEELAGMKASTLAGKKDDAVMALALACWWARRGTVGESAHPLKLY